MSKAKYGQNVSNTVYQIVKNKPKFIGECNYTTGSYKGHINEAASLLVDKKAMPKTILDGGYVDYSKLDKIFTLIELN